MDRRRPRVAAVLAWMDLEMTGLDPTRHAIVEIATLVTDDELEIIAEGPDLVVGGSEEQLAAMDDVVRAMHPRSGLLDAIGSRRSPSHEAGAADARIPPPVTSPTRHGPALRATR